MQNDIDKKNVKKVWITFFAQIMKRG